MNEGDVIFSVSFSNHPADESFEYILSSGVENSYFIGTVALFDFNNGITIQLSREETSLRVLRQSRTQISLFSQRHLLES